MFCITGCLPAICCHIGDNIIVTRLSHGSTYFSSPQCSVPCGVGQRTREVRCVSNVGDFVTDDECNMKLRPNDVENCDMGACAKSWFFSEWSSQARARIHRLLPHACDQHLGWLVIGLTQNTWSTSIFFHKTVCTCADF